MAEKEKKNDQKILFLLIVVLMLAGAAALVTIVYFYVYYGGFSGAFSKQSQEWSNFGSYFGGVSGPVISLISVILLAFTLLAQQFQISLQFQEFLKQDMHRLVESVEKDMEKLFSKKVELADDRIVDFGDLVDGLVQGEPKGAVRYAILMKKLFALNGRFHESIKTYKGNIDIPFGFREQRERLFEVHQFVVVNKKYFNQHDQLNIDLAGGFYKIL